MTHLLSKRQIAAIFDKRDGEYVILTKMCENNFRFNEYNAFAKLNKKINLSFVFVTTGENAAITICKIYKFNTSVSVS